MHNKKYEYIHNDYEIVYKNKKNNKIKKILYMSCLAGLFSFSGYFYAISSTKNQNVFLQNQSNFEYREKYNNLELLNDNFTTNSSTIDIVKKVSNAVVSINTKTYSRVGFSGYKQDEGAGSGIIVYEDDQYIYIVTNEHVIDSAKLVTVSIDDNISVNASFVGSEVESDIAVISVKKSELKKSGIDSYKIATFADSNNIEVGEDVIAIGNAAGQGKSATKGIVSALNKTINIDGKYFSAIQTDAAINPGNSGGALVNNRAQIIGVNTAKFSDYGVEGMGYSIPSNVAKSIVEKIIKTKESVPSRPYLGIQVTEITDDLIKEYNLPRGIFINNVISGGSAHQAGIIAGDILTHFNGITVNTMKDLTKVIETTNIDDQVYVNVYRNGIAITNLEVIMRDIRFAGRF